MRTAALLLLALSSLPACRSFPTAAPIGSSERSLLLPEGAAALGSSLRVHVLYVGDTLVPFAQFFEGNEGAVGLDGIFRLKSDQRRFWAPVQCFLIVHPTLGPVLFDSCVSPRQGEPGYYEGLAGNVHNDDINRIAAGDELLARLAALGFSPDDVKHVVVSHLHEDHVGELALFPHATLHVARAEWQAREHVPFIAPIYYEKNWGGVTSVSEVAFTSGSFASFGAAQDLFGDGSVVLLPTIGHTPGHLSALVNAGDHWLVLSGDAFYTLRHLDPASLAAFSPYDDEWQALHRDSIVRLVGLRAHLEGDVVLIAQHDPFEVSAKLLRPALADGRLTSEERAALLGYERALYDDEGRLRGAARPSYLPGTDDGGYGRVTSAMP